MSTSTLVSGTLPVPYIPMTVPFLHCSAPILQQDFEVCRIPGGEELWSRGGFYSPGVCFAGYRAVCTQTSPQWPLAPGETAVRCIPTGFDCDEAESMLATSVYDGITLWAPAFEIRWRAEDLGRVPPSSDTSTTTIDVPTTFPTRRASVMGDATPSYRPPASPSPTASPTGHGDDEAEDEDELRKAEEAPRSLPTASIAGIAAGVSVGLLTVSMTAICLLLRRQRRQNERLRPRRAEEEEEGSLAAVCPVQPVELGDSRLEPKELEADSTTIGRTCLDETSHGAPMEEDEGVDGRD